MAGLTNFPLVSVIINNYNGKQFIDSCLISVFAANYPNFEVIFVDNASSDGSLGLVREKFGGYPRLKVIENKESLGPAKGRNIGIEVSRGKYIAFLDNDTEVDTVWLQELVQPLEEDPKIAAAQSKLLLTDRKTIDTCGHYLSIFGFPYEIGVGESDCGQYGNITEIFGARSAAMFIRKDVLEKIGYFDDDFFMHGEETDLSWRVWLSGFRIIFVPRSVVYHKRGGSFCEESRYAMFYEGAKNCTKYLLKNLGLKWLLLILPLHVFGWLAICLSHLLRGRFRLVRAVIKGLLWDVFNIKRVLKNRKEIQAKRVVSDAQIMPVIMGNLGFLSLLRKGFAWISRI